MRAILKITVYGGGPSIYPLSLNSIVEAMLLIRSPTNMCPLSVEFHRKGILQALSPANMCPLSVDVHSRSNVTDFIPW